MKQLFEWLWGFLPDRCEMPGCCRKGVRGNENIIDDTFMCDYCTMKWMATGGYEFIWTKHNKLL